MERFWRHLTELMLKVIDPVSLAILYKEHCTTPVLAEHMLQWVEDLWHLGVLNEQALPGLLHHEELLAEYQRIIVAGLDLERLWRLWQRLLQTPLELAGNVQPLLWYENLFIDFSGVCVVRRMGSGSMVMGR